MYRYKNTYNHRYRHSHITRPIRLQTNPKEPPKHTNITPSLIRTASGYISSATTVTTETIKTGSKTTSGLIRGSADLLKWVVPKREEPLNIHPSVRSVLKVA